MARSCSCGSKQTTGTADDVAAVTDILESIYCLCEEKLRSEIGEMACELFRRIDLEGQHPERAAEALGLDPRDAVAILGVVRRSIAGALVEGMSAGSVPDPRA